MRVSLRRRLCCLAGPALALASAAVAQAADLSAPDSPAAPGQRALEAFAGPDLQGKDGPLARLGLDLVQLYYAHEAHTARAPGRDFAPPNRLVRVRGGAVVLDAVAADDPRALRTALVDLGMTHPAVYGRYVSGRLPVQSLAAAAGLAELKLARPAYARASSGAVTSQGDTALRANLARSVYGTDGTGVLVGTLSDSYDCQGGAAADVGTGDLPPGVTVLAEEADCGSGTDEGRAMMQIVRDVAPGAAQAFHSAFNGTADFATGIGELAAAGARVINDDVIYFAEPMFQDGPIAQAVDAAAAADVAYFSAAGNEARRSYEAPFVPAFVAGQTRHDFDPGAATDTRQSITIPAHTEVTFVLQWDDPFYSVSGSPGAASDLDFVLYSAQGVSLAGGVDDNIGGDPVEVFTFENTTGQARNYQLGIRLAGGPAPGLLKYVYFEDVTVNEFATSSGTIYGHANAAGAAAVGAARYAQTPAFGVTPPLLEYFSAAGGTPILRDAAGAPTMELRQKPGFVAPDGGDTTFFGNDYESNGWPNFFGTSAAAPHAAGVAALLKGFAGGLTPAQIHAAMAASALDMGAPGTDFNSGAGLVRADEALAAVLEPLAVTTESLPAGRVDEYYEEALSAGGGLAPYTWSLAEGDLPPGVTLDAAGVLGGTPGDNPGSPYGFTAQVTDALGTVSTRALSLAVAPRYRTCSSCH